MLRSSITQQGDSVLLLRHSRSHSMLGYVSYRSLSTSQLFAALGDTELANHIRLRASGKVLMITSLAADT